MKYKIIKIKEDRHILDGYSDYKWAKFCNCTPMYINFLRHEKTIATEEFYSRIEKARNILDNI